MELIDSLKDLPDFPAEPEQLASAIRKQAKVGQSAAQRFFEVNLTSDSAGVKLLDELLNAMHAAVRPGFLSRVTGQKIPEADAARVGATLGAFYGEILREKSNGKWVRNSVGGSQFAALALTNKRSVTPLHKVAKQFSNGQEDSIWVFHAFMGRMATAAARANSMSQEERAALFAKLKAGQEERKQKRQPPQAN
jgi:hypothetical protein